MGRWGSFFIFWPHHPFRPLLVADFLPSCLFPLSPSQVVYPPDSPIPLRRTISVVAPSPPAPLLQDHPDTPASSSPLQPSLPTPSCPGPLAAASASSGVQTAEGKPQEEGGRGPAGLTSVTHTVRSVGCQTNEDPLFCPMQAGLTAPCPSCALSRSEPPPNSEDAAEVCTQAWRALSSILSPDSSRSPSLEPYPGSS